MSEFKPWEEYPEIWKTKAAFMSWVRGGIRRGLWEEHPVKLQYLNSQKFQMVNTDPRSMKRFPTVAAYRCADCGGEFKASKKKGERTKTQVDHIAGNHSLKTMDDLRAFIESMILIKSGDLQILCVECHAAKSYAEKQGIAIEEARAIKQAIAICNNKQERQFLIERGVEPASNGPARRKQVENILKEAC